MMSHWLFSAARVILLMTTVALPTVSSGHGDVQPQPVDTTGLEPLGEEWRETNPYSGKALAIEIGESAYTQNCARCHGLAGVSGGMSPDLRYLPLGPEGDEYYLPPTRAGVTYCLRSRGF